MRWIASYLVKLHNSEYKAQKPPTVAHWTPTLLRYQPTKGHAISETVTKKLTVSPLSIIPPTTGEYGTKVQNSATSYMQELRRWGSYIRGHMLNSKIHGPGEDKNLVPISSTFNKEMEGGIEKTIKDEVIARNKVVFYEIEPINWGQYKGSGHNPHRPNAEEQLPKDFKMTLKPMKLKHPGDDGTDFKNWEINPKKSALSHYSP